MKGTPRKQQADLLAIFVSVTSLQSEHLTDGSFLSHLDMDAPASQSSVLASASAADRALLSPSLSGPGSGGSGAGGGMAGLGAPGLGLGGGGEGEREGKGFAFLRSFTRRESGFMM